jgi:hypothetical protein
MGDDVEVLVAGGALGTTVTTTRPGSLEDLLP